MVRRFYFFSLFLLITFYCRAAGDSTALLHYTIDNGLPSNNVYMVIKDHYGYIWLATDNGVVKYNGYNFRIFNTNDGLPSNDVWRLHEDKRGRMWLYSNSYQIGYISGDVYHPVPLSNSNSVLNLKEIADNGNVLLLWYIDNGVEKIGIVDKDVIGVLTVIKLGSLNARKKGSIYYGVLCSDFSIWLFGYDRQLYRYRPLDPPGHQLVASSPSQAFEQTFARANVAYAFKDLFYYFRFNDNKVYCLNIATCQLSLIYLNKDNPEERIVIGESLPNRIQFTTDKHVFSIKKGETAISSKITLPTYLNSGIRYYYSDDTTSEWISTNSSGLLHTVHYQKFWGMARLAPELSTSKRKITISGKTLWWDSKSSELIITEGLKIIEKKRFKGLGELLSVCKNGKTGLILSFAYGIYTYDLDERVLRSTFSGEKPLIMVNYGVYKPRGYMEQVHEPTKSSFFNNCERVKEISDSSFILFQYGNVHLINIGKNRNTAEVILTAKTFGFLKDSTNGLIIIYNEKNVFLYSNEWKKARLTGDLLQSAGIQNIVNILATPHGNYVIHCAGKMFKFNYRKKAISEITTNFNLSTSRSFIWRDYLVIVGDFGLAYARINDHDEVSRFRLLPNFRNPNYSRITNSSMDSLGSIWINCDKGTYRLSFDSVVKSRHLFSFDKTRMMLFSLKAPYQRKLHNNDTISVPQRTGKVSLDVINYFGSTGMQYHFRVKSGKWQTSSSGEIFLENIIPGEFYKVQYYVEDAFWNSDLRTLYVYQPLFWYQTFLWKSIFWTTAIILFCLTLIIASLITRRFVARSNDRKRWQTELELRAIHSQINPHFIFNTLATALFFISKQMSTEAYDHVSRFSKLLRSYLKSSRERLILLSDEIEILGEYIKLQNARFRRSFNYEIVVAPDVSPFDIQIPSLLLQPIVENAINHGLFHKEENGFLLISFAMGGNSKELICTIDDNGVGRSRSKFIQSKSNYKESYGSALTQELIDVFQKYEQMDIHIEYIDKQEPETGTTVRLTIRNIKLLSAKPG